MSRLSPNAGVLHDMAAMLRALADAGFKPLVYYVPPKWVAYSQAEVRTWRSFRGDDPLTVTREFYLHRCEHPNTPPAPPAPPASSEPIVEARAYRQPPAAREEAPRPVTPVEVAPGAIAHVTHRDPSLLTALGAMTRAAVAALRASVPQEQPR